MKKVIIAVVLTAIVCISGTVLAVNQINASQITYTDSNNNKTTVDAALNDLYTTANKPILNKITMSIQTAESGTGNASTSIEFTSDIKNNYHYFKIISVNPNEYTAFCNLRGAIAPNYTGVDLTENTEYETSIYRNIWVNVGSNDTASTSNMARCNYKVEFYNK